MPLQQQRCWTKQKKNKSNSCKLSVNNSRCSGIHKRGLGLMVKQKPPGKENTAFFCRSAALTWNHLACRSAASVARHVCPSRTSSSSSSTPIGLASSPWSPSSGQTGQKAWTCRPLRQLHTHSNTRMYSRVGQRIIRQTHWSDQMSQEGGIWEIVWDSHAQVRISHQTDRRNRRTCEYMHLAGRPEPHSRCRSVAEGNGHARLVCYQSLHRMRMRAWQQIQIKITRLMSLSLGKASFLGAMLVFSPWRGCQMFMFGWDGLSTPGPCGERCCHDRRPSHGRTTAEEERQQMTT